MDSADTLRHIQRANVAHFAPIGNGLRMTVGLFNSWAADNSPYMMFGVNAMYPVNEAVTVAGFIINGYFHLANPNDQPSYGG